MIFKILKIKYIYTISSSNIGVSLKKTRNFPLNSVFEYKVIFPPSGIFRDLIDDGISC